MSRRTREGRRLAEDLARVVAARADSPRLRVSTAEARRIKAAAELEQKERRANSALTLLRRQYMPWVAAGAVFAAGAVLWLMRWLSNDPLLPVATAALAGLVLAWAGWMTGRRTTKWRGRVHLGAGTASAYLLYAAGSGPSWRAPLVLVLGTVLVSSSWWKANRPKHPLAPSRGAVPVPVDLSINGLWEENLGAPGAVLAGSWLDHRDTSRTNCESWTVNLRPGKQTITGVLSQLELIAGGLFTPVKQLVLEPHPDHNPNHVKLTVVQHSPIEETMPYRGARLAGDQGNLIDVGPYGDGDGYAQWRMWAPGEKPMTGSWLSGLVIAGTGIGKSRLMELLAAGYMASGNAVVWFVDPQGGASSPALQEYADWYVSSEGTARMITALEKIAEAREKQNSARKWQRFDPSPERPGIVVFMDEFHVTIARYQTRLTALARKTQKVGIAFVGLTQGGGLASLGDDILRASMMPNLIVMKTMSNQTKNLLPGLTVDPETLPKIPGFGYTIGTDGSRTAPFRSEYLETPEHWFKRYPMAKLDALSAGAAGDVYGLRREAADEEQEANRLWVEQMEAGTLPAEADEPDLDDWGKDDPQPAAFQVVKFPLSPAARPQDKPARERVLVAVAQGVTRTADIQERVGLGKSQCAAVLKELVEKNELEQPTRGVYALAGSASPPER
jgi:bacterioferritin-associated ferredoxin